MKREIEVLPGSNLESVVYTLLAAKARGESVYCEFNGHKLYSDTVSMDSAFMEVTGQTKADFDKAQEEWRKNYEREQKEAEQRAKDNIPNWIHKLHRCSKHRNLNHSPNQRWILKFRHLP